MVVQSKKAQILLLFFSIAFTLSLGIAGYLLMLKAPAVSAEEAKWNAELLLYLSLLFSLLIGTLNGYIFIRNRNILKELDKIIEMSTYNNFSPVQSLERLSTIGEKIGQLYKNISVVSEKRALKISSMHNVTQLLLNNIPLPVIITDVRGVVTYLSKQFREKYPDQTGLISTSLVNFMPDFKIRQVLEHFNENYASLQTRLNKMDLTVYPVRNREYEVANLVVLIGKGSLTQDESLQGRRPKQRREPEWKGLLAKLTGKRYKGRS